MSELHNKLAGEILRRIVEPTIESGGDRTSILVLAESVITGVILFCAKKDGVSQKIVADALFDRVRERLSEISP
ncbi:MAG: hypothetical protein KGL39_25200 [Patescibacteria group bacterium]|nr:hypothetical protein [Patescibacteria group bacterium]